MADVVTLDAEAPGKGSFRYALVNSPRVMKFVTGSITFDSSYPTGGEDIATIFSQFTSCKGILVEDANHSAGTGKTVRIDYTNKKAMLYTNAGTPAEVADASDQSGTGALRFFGWGY